MASATCAARWIFLLAALAGAGELGCAAGLPSPNGPARKHWAPAYAFGIWGKAELDVRDDCPSAGASGVRIGATWSTLLVGVATLGMYTPREVEVQCRERP